MIKVTDGGQRWAKYHAVSAQLKRKTIDGDTSSEAPGKRTVCNTSSSDVSPSQPAGGAAPLPQLRMSYSGFSNPATAAVFGCEWVRPVCLSPGPAPPLLLQISSAPSTGVYGYGLGSGCAVQVKVKQGNTVILDTVAALSETRQLR